MSNALAKNKFRDANNQVRLLEAGDIICVDACNDYQVEIDISTATFLFEAEIISNTQIGQYSHLVFKVFSIFTLPIPKSHQPVCSRYVRPWTLYTKPLNA